MEATHYDEKETLKVIDEIHELGCAAGISIKPCSSVKDIEKYLDKVELVLVMSVEPGKGGQNYIENSTNKINDLYNIRKENNYKYLIEVDGGINNETKKYAKNADILVVGSYITNNNYEEKINEFKGL